MEIVEKQLEKIFETEKYYNEMEKFCREKGFIFSLRALPYARKAYMDKERRGEDKAPYYIHPLRVAKYLTTFPNITDMDIAVALLHDVEEENQECHLTDLDVPEVIKTYVAVLSFTSLKFPTIEEKRRAQVPYYTEIINHLVTARIKLLDRVDSLSTVPGAFKKAKACEFFEETETFYPTVYEALLKLDPDNSNLYWFYYHTICHYISTIRDTWNLKEETAPEFKKYLILEKASNLY